MAPPILSFPEPALTGSRIVANDGRVAYLAPVTPAAKPLIQEAMRRLSPQTSLRRFFTVRRQLSDDELDRLTYLDGWWRFAVGATAVHSDGASEGVAVARWVRSEEDPSTAEFALLVVDAWQRQGIGSAMLARLRAIAAQRGIARFTGLVLPDNVPMLALLERDAPQHRRMPGRDFLTVELPLASTGIRVAA